MEASIQARVTNLQWSTANWSAHGSHNSIEVLTEPTSEAIDIEIPLAVSRDHHGIKLIIVSHDERQSVEASEWPLIRARRGAIIKQVKRRHGEAKITCVWNCMATACDLR